MAPSRRNRALSSEDGSSTANAATPQQSFIAEQLMSVHTLLERHPWQRRFFALCLFIMVTGYPSFTSYTSVQYLLKSPLPNFVKKYIVHDPATICRPSKPYVSHLDTEYYSNLQQYLNISSDAEMEAYLRMWLCAVPPDVTDDPKSLEQYYKALDDFHADVGGGSVRTDRYGSDSVDEKMMTSLRRLEMELMQQTYQPVESEPLHKPE